jgi:outer membrane protein assembly factor BamE
MRSLSVVSALGAALALAGCQSLQSSDSFLSRLTPYKVEVVQGNVVTKEQAAQVKPGMTRAQIRDVLGSPLLTDPFHLDRWDYVFTIRRQGAEPQQRRIVVLFDGEKLKSIDTGGELPAERDFVASIDTFKTSRNAPPLALSDEQVKALPAPKAAPAEAAPAAAAASAVAPVRTYPPLEPR